ncbi:hypothetical protein M2093_001181 [Breznakia sp. PH1-1]|nr:hypothetical protein [Breznakia sp. PH1-1]MDH6404195.1 hypothetical protein [Breznakia sp. PF1-11]MDH6411920.1 hypothetical protein [Breznakia sp. PFB1-11]MDH6414183.1 hypothetical protein [Breznakia sp. PFB1-14]MDH6415994.1 hypothetical protein [Breznakia sp. PFB1-4]MDH6418936.1 hypothetical protein [Breznakia sp. PFB1-12]MDH6473485.1 hypothetical protein [Breznakia sp. PFB2-30]MDH6475921.1 hypothetical protein [Breznakia sp. PFB1-19]
MMINNILITKYKEVLSVITTKCQSVHFTPRKELYETI